jgi:hypothetical protein
MPMVVYMLLSPSGKAYIGKDAYYPARARSHRWIAATISAIEYASPIHAAIRKHSWEKFEVRVLDDSATSLAELSRLERHLIARHKTRLPHGYNQTDGGDGAQGLRHTPEAKAKIGAGNRGKVRTAEARSLISRAKKGRPLTQEHRANISSALSWLKDKPRASDVRRKIKEGHLAARGNLAELFGPCGEHVVTNDLCSLARKYCLQTQHLYHVLNGHRPIHKGWRGHWLMRGGNAAAARAASLPKKLFLSRVEAMRAKCCIYTYEIISPSGVRYKTNNLSDFCRQHGIDQRKMSQVVKSSYSRKSHKGWTGGILAIRAESRDRCIAKDPPCRVQAALNGQLPLKRPAKGPLSGTQQTPKV